MEVSIYLKPSWIKVDCPDENLSEQLYRYFTVEDKEKKKQIAKSRKDGQFLNPERYSHHFYNKKYGLLPIGLLFNLKKKISRYPDVNLKSVDLRQNKKFQRTKIDFNKVLPPSIKLREYQKTAIQKFFTKTSGNGILEGSVASGKTLIFAVITKIINKPTLIFVNRIDLAHQGREEFVKKYGFKSEEVGIIQGSNIIEKKINFVTIQSLEKINQNNWNKYKLLIVDETHHCSSEGFQKMMMVSQADFRLGVSGTVTGLSSFNFLKVKSFLGEVFYKITTDELVRAGFLAKPYAHIYPVNEPEVDPYAYGSNWIKIQSDLIVHNEYRNNLIIEKVTRTVKPALILVESIEHGEYLESKLPGSKFLQGKDDKETRNKYRHLMDKGKTDVIIATRIWNEGVNLVALKTIVNGGGMKSYVSTVQKAGRGMRRGKNKKMILLIDFMDKTHPILTRHSYKRISEYRSMGFEIEIKE